MIQHIDSNSSSLQRNQVQYFTIYNMSRKFTSTSTGGDFGLSSVFKQQEFIRQIVENEVLLIFDDIKLQIQQKIKSIDRNIFEIRNQVKRINQKLKNQHDLSDILAKVEKIQAQMQLLRYHQQFQLRTSKAKSLDKYRQPIFRKANSEHQGFSSVILGLETQSKPNLETKIKEKPQNSPVPYQTSLQKSQLSLKKDKQLHLGLNNQRKNLILQDSGAIHRWLHQNNSKQSSFFISTIRQEDVEESVFN